MGGRRGADTFGSILMWPVGSPECNIVSVAILLCMLERPFYNPVLQAVVEHRLCFARGIGYSQCGSVTRVSAGQERHLDKH